MHYTDHHGYEHLERGEFESNEMLLNTQYNYVPQNGWLFPGSGLNYVIGIDGHKTLVSQKRLKNPGTFMGTLFCPCFAAEEPLSDESKSRFKNCLGSFTFLICLAQLILLGVMLIKDGFADVRENPSFGPNYSTLVNFGGNSAHLILHEKQVWRFFSSTYLFAGILHALCNLIIQFRLGMYLEREWGVMWYMLTYITAGVGGNLLSCILQPHDVGVGATAPVAGLIAAFGVQVALSYKINDAFQRKLQAFQFLVFFIMMLILILCPFINWSNVVGGFIVGLLFGITVSFSKIYSFITKHFVYSFIISNIWAAEEKHCVWIIPTALLLGGFGGAFSYFFIFMK